MAERKTAKWLGMIEAGPPGETLKQFCRRTGASKNAAIAWSNRLGRPLTKAGQPRSAKVA